MKKMILLFAALPFFAFSFKSVTNVGTVFDNNVYKSTAASTQVSVGASLTQSVVLFGRINNATYYKSNARINYYGFRNQNLNNRYSLYAAGAVRRYLSPFFNVSFSPNFYYNNFVNDTLVNSSRISGIASMQWLPGDIFTLTFNGVGTKSNYINYKLNDSIKYGASVVISADISYSATASLNIDYFTKEYKNLFIYDPAGTVSTTAYRADNTISCNSSIEWFALSNAVLDAAAGVIVSKSNRNYLYSGKVIDNFYDNNRIVLSASLLYFLKRMLIYPNVSFRQTIYSNREAIDKNYSFISGSKMRESNIAISVNNEFKILKNMKAGFRLGYEKNISNDYYSAYTSVSGGIYSIFYF